MNVHVPVYVERQSSNGEVFYRVRPLFFKKPMATHAKLERALSRLAVDVREELQSLGKLMRHDELARWTFSPEVETHRLDLVLELKSDRVKCCFLFVTFEALGRRVAFTPSVPELWFEVRQNEQLHDRATEVFAAHYRQKEKEDESEFKSPAEVSIEGKAWVTTIELPIDPVQEIQTPEEAMRALFGEEAVLDGGAELRRVGRCLDRLYPDDLDRVLLRDAEVEELNRLLRAPDRRPVLILGTRLVGKTALVHEFVHRKVSETRHGERYGYERYAFDNNVWLVSPQRLISGMSYVGQWENRLIAILKEMKKRDHILYLDDLLGLYQAGQSCESKLSVAHVLKPYVERRELRLVAEITPEAFRVLRERDRGFADLFHVLPVPEPTDEQNLRILVSVMRQLEGRHRCRFALGVLPCVLDLERRHVRGLSFPGKAAVFLERLAVKSFRGNVTRQMVLDEFHAQSGLNLAVLDDRVRLDRNTIKQELGQRVIGQGEAVDAAADVVSVAKARLNDPDRPLAAFLFLGPTGVGKTQSAKALAAYLFGDAEKLIRFDMNEFVDPGAAARLVGTFDNPEGLLTAAIRRQPFSVLLLDEIEKAHPEVHDLLLQVLGEGRLTDALGRVVDFTCTICILTSNLGVREAESRLGFQKSDEETQTEYLAAVERFFRPEFFNRLDRVVPFGRLAREDITRIAGLLIEDVFRREGLIRRKCILHVDPAAMGRVVERGYDPLLGARALKRAIERYLAQPVATRLAAEGPAGITVVGVYSGPELITVRVQTLTEVDRVPAPTLPESPRAAEELLGRAQAALRRIEGRFEHLRPDGPITAGSVKPEHDRYFTIREQVQRVREMLRAIDRDREMSRVAEMGPPSYPVNVQRYLTQAGMSMVMSGYRTHHTGPVKHNTLGEIAAAADIHAFLQELTAHATASGDRLKNQMRRLFHQVAMLQVIADCCERDEGEQALVCVEPVNDGKADRLRAQTLATALFHTFRTDLGLHATLPEEHTAVGLLRGPHALTLARTQEGTHLFHPQSAGLLPIRVTVLPFRSGEDPQSTLSSRETEWRARLDALRRGEDVSEDAFALPPVVRIYDERGSTLDLRTGMVTPTMPTFEALRECVLAALPLPAEVLSTES